MYIKNEFKGYIHPSSEYISIKTVSYNDNYNKIEVLYNRHKPKDDFTTQWLRSHYGFDSFDSKKATPRLDYIHNIRSLSDKIVKLLLQLSTYYNEYDEICKKYTTTFKIVRDKFWERISNNAEAIPAYQIKDGVSAIETSLEGFTLEVHTFLNNVKNDTPNSNQKRLYLSEILWESGNLQYNLLLLDKCDIEDGDIVRTMIKDDDNSDVALLPSGCDLMKGSLLVDQNTTFEYRHNKKDGYFHYFTKIILAEDERDMVEMEGYAKGNQGFDDKWEFIMFEDEPQFTNEQKEGVDSASKMQKFFSKLFSDFYEVNRDIGKLSTNQKGDIGLSGGMWDETTVQIE